MSSNVQVKSLALKKCTNTFTNKINFEIKQRFNDISYTNLRKSLKSTLNVGEIQNY